VSGAAWVWERSTSISTMSRLSGRDSRGDFDRNSPRPPVPGEETVNPFRYCQENGKNHRLY